MGTGLEFVALVGLGISAASAYQQYEAGKDQEDAMRRQGEASKAQFEAQRRASDIQNMRQVRAAVRQARLARAEIVNAGANTGTLTSSGVTGGASSVGAQLRSNLNFFSDMAVENRNMNAASVRSAEAAQAAGEAQGQSAQWGALGSLGGTIFSAAGGMKTIYGKP